MIVELLAHTISCADDPGHRPMSGWAIMHDAGWRDSGEQGITDADELAEFAGRLCYQSWDRPNPATATNELYLANIIMQQHFSVLEHASATFYVAGVSRSLTHELVRHRHLSFSQVSQRYVDESNPVFVMPPVINDLLKKKRFEAGYEAQAFESHIVAANDAATDAYKIIVSRLQAAGFSRKEARQAARAVLPNMTETKLVVTGNLRAWRDVITKRNSVHADKEIQELAKRILVHLKAIAPNTFQDM